MTSPNYYQLAKQGEPDAIAIYLNDKLSDRCLTTQVKRNDDEALVSNSTQRLRLSASYCPIALSIDWVITGVSSSITLILDA